MPTSRVQIPFDRTFTDGEFQRLQLGLVPESMDDRWFIFLEAGWLYFVRSWTGYCIFQVRLQLDGPHQVLEAWANRDRRQYGSEGEAKDVELLTTLIDEILARTGN